MPTLTPQLPDVLQSGKLEPYTEIVHRRTGKYPSHTSAWRHCKRGLRGGTLKCAAVFHNGTWMTTQAAFDEFLIRQTEAAQSASRSQDDDAELRAKGLL